MKTKGKKKRIKSLTAAEACTLHQLYNDLHRPRILRIDMQHNILSVVAYGNIRDHVPSEYIKNELARQLADALIANDAIKLDIVDDFGDFTCKLLRGSVRVVMPKGV